MNTVAALKTFERSRVSNSKTKNICWVLCFKIPRRNQKEAAKAAGYADKICEKTGSLLTNPDKYPHVVAYIEKLRDSAAKIYKDHYRHLRRLDDLSKKAEDKGQLAAAINAEFRLGQSVGLYVDKRKLKFKTCPQCQKKNWLNR